MDIEFIVQDTYTLTRPQWKLATNLEEAAKALQLAIAQDQKNSGIDRNVEQDDASVRSSSIEGDGELGDPEAESDRDSEIGGDDEEGEADDDGEVSYRLMPETKGVRLINHVRTRTTSTINPSLTGTRSRKKKQSW